MFCSRFTNDAIRDYGKEENARGAERAIRALEGRLDGRYPAIIGGREVESGKWIASVCLARPDLVVGHVASCTRAQVDEAIAEAKNPKPVASAEGMVDAAGEQKAAGAA